MITLAILFGLMLVSQVVAVVRIQRFYSIFEIVKLVLKGLRWKILLSNQMCFYVRSVKSL